MGKYLKMMALMVLLTVYFVACDKLSTTNNQLSTNLVHNGDFEQGVSTPDGWHTYNQFLNDVTGWATDEVHSGKHSLKIENIGGTDAYWQGKEIVLDKAANAFEASIWTKTKDIKEGKGKFELAFDVYLKDSNAVKRVTANILQTKHDWEKTTSRFLLYENIVKIVPYIIFSGDIGTVYLDDISVNSFLSNSVVLFDSNNEVMFADLYKNIPKNKVVTVKNSEKTYELKGSQQIVSSNFIPVDLNKTYKLSGAFRSTGKENSLLYFGYVCYDKNKELIYNYTVEYVKDTETDLIKGCSADDLSIYIKDGSRWLPDPSARIAFDVDISGRYEDLPNSNVSSMGIKKISPFGRCWIVELSNPCGKNYPPKTKIREHTMKTENYIYNAVFNTNIPDVWTKYQGLTKENRHRGDLFPGTKYIKILILGNYQQPNEVGMEFKNIKLEEFN